MMRLERMLDFVDENPSFYKLDVYNRRLIFLERYLSNYMDFTLGAEDSVGKLLSLTPKEDYRTNSRMNLRLDQYVANEIKESFGFNLNEFLELPTWFMEEILTRQRKVLKERREMAEAEKRKAAQAGNNLDIGPLAAGLHQFNRS